MNLDNPPKEYIALRDKFEARGDRIAELERALKVARPYVNSFAEHGPSQRSKAGATEDLKIVEAALRQQ